MFRTTLYFQTTGWLCVALSLGLDAAGMVTCDTEARRLYMRKVSVTHIRASSAVGVGYLHLARGSTIVGSRVMVMAQHCLCKHSSPKRKHWSIRVYECDGYTD